LALAALSLTLVGAASDDHIVEINAYRLATEHLCSFPASLNDTIQSIKRMIKEQIGHKRSIQLVAKVGGDMAILDDTQTVSKLDCNAGSIKVHVVMSVSCREIDMKGVDKDGKPLLSINAYSFKGEHLCLFPVDLNDEISSIKKTINEKLGVTKLHNYTKLIAKVGGDMQQLDDTQTVSELDRNAAGSIKMHVIRPVSNEEIGMTCDKDGKPLKSLRRRMASQRLTNRFIRESIRCQSS